MSMVSLAARIAGSAIVVAAALALSACNSRDTQLAEQVAAAQDAARRAEAAQEATEKALAKLTGQQPAVIEEDGPDKPDDEVTDDTEHFDNTIVAPPAPA